MANDGRRDEGLSAEEVASKLDQGAAGRIGDAAKDVPRRS
jgi:hypothetical protein